MQLFIDTANVSEIRTAWNWGILDGVTTNPTHIAKSGRDFDEVLHEIFSIVDGPISVETVSTRAEDIVREGQAIAAFHRNAVAKVPVMAEGLKAVKQLSSEGIKTNVTLCFSPVQAYLAAKALAASVRTGKEVLEALLAGADVATMPMDVMESLYKHTMTDIGLKMFLDDWKSVPESKLFGALALR